MWQVYFFQARLMAQEGDVLVAAASVFGKLGPNLGARVLLGNWLCRLGVGCSEFQSQLCPVPPHYLCLPHQSQPWTHPPSDPSSVSIASFPTTSLASHIDLTQC